MAEPLTVEDFVPPVRVIKLGTSSAIIIPKKLVRALGLTPGCILKLSDFTVDGFSLRRVPHDIKRIEVREVDRRE